MAEEEKTTAPSDKDKYKDTVFLPKTDFPMRGGLPQKEPEILQQWKDMDLYGQLREQSKNKEKFILHDGPPYANGHIHIGHAMNKILKDVVVKSYQMMGYNAPYVPGWDCHGLPIEWKIEEQYREKGQDKDDVDILKFRAECREFAQKWVDVQIEDFQRLGVTGDWKNPYLTMTNRAEGKIVREIHKFLNNGGLYKGVKPVMWSTVEKTALAEAEIEYKEHKSVTVWVKFPVVKTNCDAAKDASIVIWTTTPWTLPSNRAVAFGENIEYGVFEIKAVGEDSRAKVGDKIILALSLADKVKETAKIEDWDQVATLKGSDLEGAICHHPLHGQGYDFDVPALAGDFVTDEDGTGFVHIAPGHGVDDYMLVQAHNLHSYGSEAAQMLRDDDALNNVGVFESKDHIEITDNVADDGKFRDHVPLFAGLEVYTQDGKMGPGNFAPLKALDEAGALLAKGSLRHEYPHSWRSKAPVIFRTTPQWFIAMNNNLRLREKALKGIEETKWVPEKGQARIRAMIENRPDWCISRQRTWGVPIALFINKETGEPLKDATVLSRIGDIFEEEGADSWWSRDAQDFLGDDYKAEEYDQLFDILDVWFESGATHEFVVGDTQTWPDYEGVGDKIDLYLEGSDQHRGWFHTSLLESCGTKGHAPYKTVLTHGFVLDDKGYKMSKSLGNVVDPLKTMEQYGADILRLWVMTTDYAEDIRMGKDTLKGTGDLYRRIRNTLRFLLGALEGFDKDEIVAVQDMPELERYMLHRLYETDKDVRSHIKDYDFNHLAHMLHNFCNQDLSAFYFDIRKDSLYCDRLDDPKRCACRTVLYHIFDCLTAWLAPILSFTAEEAWDHRPPVFEAVGSVHLREFPIIPSGWNNENLANGFECVVAFRRVILGATEPHRANKSIGSSLEASPTLYFSKKEMCKKGVEIKRGDLSVGLGISENLFDAYKNIWERLDWAEICVTSNIAIQFVEAIPEDVFSLRNISGVGVSFQKAEGNKCDRCWKILPEVGANTQHPDLCKRCANAVKAHQKQEAA